MSKFKLDTGIRRIIEIAYCIIAFVVYGIAYNSSLPLIKYNYGLYGVRNENVAYTDFVSAGYVSLVKQLYFFLGEKVSVIKGLHIVCGCLSFLLLVLAVKKFYRLFLTLSIPAVFMAVSLWTATWLNFDGWILIEVGSCLLIYLIIQIVFGLLKLNFNPEDSVRVETLSEREKRESQAPKTIINEKGETVKLLANPLPGPKRHVKRTLDYDFEVPEDRMFYDIEVGAADDYDLQ